MRSPILTTGTEEPFKIFDLLKAATARVHGQVEEGVSVFDPQFDLPRYLQLLKRFYGFWAPLEAKLLLVKSLRHPALALRARMKSHLLAADLQILGHETSALPQCVELPDIDSFPAGLGCLYVLEGSTLGARIISRRLESHLRLRAETGGAFFNAYGEAVGQRWSEFRSFVTVHLSPEQSGETINAALLTFESLLAWLNAPSPPSPKLTSTSLLSSEPVYKLKSPDQAYTAPETEAPA